MFIIIIIITAKAACIVDPDTGVRGTAGCTMRHAFMDPAAWPGTDGSGSTMHAA